MKRERSNSQNGFFQYAQELFDWMRSNNVEAAPDVHPTEITEMPLIEPNIEPELSTTDELGNTALHQAIMAGDYDEVKKLLTKQKIDVNCQNLAGETPLMLSLFTRDGNCYSKMAIWLVEAGAVFQSSSKDREILEHLIKNEAWKLAYCLLDKGLKVDRINGSGRTLLHQAASESDVSIVKKLIGLDANPNAQDDQSLTPLHLAASKGNYQVTQILVRNGGRADLQDQQGRTPLHIAIQKGYVQVCRALIETGIGLEETNAFSKKALTLALESALKNDFDDTNCEIVLLLLRQGAKLQEMMRNRSFDILLGVIKANHLELFERLVGAGLNINSQNSSNESLLQVAVKRQPTLVDSDSVDLVAKMITLGASTEITDNNGNTLLHVVQNKRDTETLLRRGLAIEAQNKDGLTPLFAVAQKQRQGVCEVLLTRKPSLYQPEKQKNVMHAAKAGNRHTPFSKWLKLQITLPPVYLKEIENFFFEIFKNAKQAAESFGKKLTIAIGECHGEYGIYQIEVALMKAADRAALPNLYIEHLNHDISKASDYMPLAYAKRHTRFQIYGVDNYRSVSENSIDLDKSGIMLRDFGMMEGIIQANGHGLGIFGAAHLEGLVAKLGTKLDPKKFFMIPINLSQIDTSSSLGFSFYENRQNAIQITRDGFNEKEVYDVIQKWNGVNLRMASPSYRRPYC